MFVKLQFDQVAYLIGTVPMPLVFEYKGVCYVNNIHHRLQNVTFQSCILRYNMWKKHRLLVWSTYHIFPLRPFGPKLGNISRFFYAASRLRKTFTIQIDENLVFYCLSHHLTRSHKGRWCCNNNASRLENKGSSTLLQVIFACVHELSNLFRRACQLSCCAN